MVEALMRSFGRFAFPAIGVASCFPYIQAECAPPNGQSACAGNTRTLGSIWEKHAQMQNPSGAAAESSGVEARVPIPPAHVPRGSKRHVDKSELVVPCTKCGKAFKNTRGLGLHMFQKHNEVLEAAVQTLSAVSDDPDAGEVEAIRQSIKAIQDKMRGKQPAQVDTRTPIERGWCGAAKRSYSTQAQKVRGPTLTVLPSAGSLLNVRAFMQVP